MSLGTWWAIPALLHLVPFMAAPPILGGTKTAMPPRSGPNGPTTFIIIWRHLCSYERPRFSAGTISGIILTPSLSDAILRLTIPAPPVSALIPNYLNLINGPKLLWLITQHSVGRMDAKTRELVPERDFHRVIWEARAYTTVLVGVIAWAIASGTVVPLLFVGLPSFYGAWLFMFFAITQHAGLKEDVLDHRLNICTVYINPVFRFLYLNMNCHLEHHLFPAVPYHNLPALHEEVKAYLLPPKPSMMAAYKEVVHALKMQRRDPTWELPSPYLPPGGREPSPRLQTGGFGPMEPTRSERPDILGYSNRVVDLGPSAGFTEGKVARIDHGGSTYALYCLAEDDFALTDGLCTHAGTHLADGRLEGCIIECPKHNGRFDVRTGEPKRRPATVPLQSYSVKVVDGRIIADLRPRSSSEAGRFA